MPFQRFITAGLLMLAPLALPLGAIASQIQPLPKLMAQAEPVPTAQQILNACTQNQAERLPNPFTDVPRRHWAFKAVLTIHYCGADQQAAARLLKQTTKQPSPEQTTQAMP